MNLPFPKVGTHSTASLTCPEEMGTRWNASLPGSWYQNRAGKRLDKRLTLIRESRRLWFFQPLCAALAATAKASSRGVLRP